MKIVVNKKAVKIFTFGTARSVSIYPFIFLKFNCDKTNTYLLNHERIHIQQQKECFVIPFFVIYFLNFVINFFRYFSFDKAYRNICFEKEAFSNEERLDYLQNRKSLSFINYF